MIQLKKLLDLEQALGPVICFFLGLFLPLFPKPASVSPEKIRKILLIKFWGIGSLTLATPLITKARKVFPNAEIHLLTLASNRELVKMLPVEVKGHFVDLGKNVFSAVSAFVRSLYRVFLERFEMVFDMEFYTRASAIVTFFTLAPHRIGYHSPRVWRGMVHNRRIPFNVYRHVSCNFLSLLEPFGYEASSVPEIPALRISQHGIEEADALLRELDLTGKPFFIFNPNASELSFERRWPADHFVELAAFLLRTYDVKILFIGSKSEGHHVRSLVERVRHRIEGAVDVSGRLSIEGLAEFCRRSLLMFSNDSGPLHLAAACGARVVGFFGPETPILYGLIGDRHLEFFSNISCSPCINIEGGKRLECWHETNKCLQGITVDKVCGELEKKFGRFLEPYRRTG